eukprot:CAMPEP_0185188892 /NCGR_PEP_ID=MMETSP1140-20130426/5693_1 /TAXON_ID=298111 /ORGANISM="Pavlova sp., Strain CCMP459" /LENGTH=70 /DNA_ID=CAMNT_0027755409 /DNA_START=270 /DNA_END=479 /DNA_ORIENTATION=-
MDGSMPAGGSSSVPAASSALFNCGGGADAVAGPDTPLVPRGSLSTLGGVDTACASGGGGGGAPSVLARPP